MNKKGQMVNGLTMGIFAVIFAIIAVVVVNALISSGTNLTAATQSVNYTNAPNSQVFTLSPVGSGLDTTSVTVTNGTETVASANLSVTTAGSLNITHDVNVSNFVASWNYADTGYISDSTTRTIVGFIVIFVALGALAIAAALIFL